MPQFWRAAFQDVRNINIIPINTHGRKIFVQQLSGGTDKRCTGQVLFFSRGFSDEHELGIRISYAKNTIGSRFVQLAFCTCAANLL